MATQEIQIEKMQELEELTIAFVVRNQGNWPESALKRFRDYANSKALIQDEEAFAELLERKRATFHEDQAHLYVCQGNACQKRQRFDVSPEALDNIAQDHACAVTLTACQGHCGSGPVATLRGKDGCEMFSQFEEEKDWRVILNHAEATANPDAKCAGNGAVDMYRFDPEEGQRKPSLALQKFRFLLGRHRGDGKMQFGTGTFSREFEGSWQSSGRFIQLKLALTIDNDGVKHAYHSLFMIGATADGRNEIWNFTSVGDAVVSQLIEDGGRFYFDEKAAPKSEVKTRRTVWIPREGGFEQQAQAEKGDGVFNTVSTLAMRRIG